MAGANELNIASKKNEQISNDSLISTQIVFASVTNLSVTSVASKALTIQVQSFLSESNVNCRALDAFSTAALEVVTPDKLVCTFVLRVANAFNLIALKIKTQIHLCLTQNKLK